MYSSYLRPGLPRLRDLSVTLPRPSGPRSALRAAEIRVVGLRTPEHRLVGVFRMSDRMK